MEKLKITIRENDQNQKEGEEMELEKKKDKKSWFALGSPRRACLALLSYILMLAFLCTSFVGVSYLYWFNGETADSYWETERFEKKLTSQLKKAVPAIKHYLLQDIQKDQEMVEIYTLEEGRTENGKTMSNWKKTASYTCESGAEIAGFQTNYKDAAWEPQVVYKKKNDSFLYFNDFNTLDTKFIAHWESQYQTRESGGVQKYCAVSSQTMKNWILNDGAVWDTDVYGGNLIEGARYIMCFYHEGKGERTALAYSRKKDRWYFLGLDEDDFVVEKTAFHMPDTVYFPLYGAAKTKSSIEFSSGFSSADLYLQDGILCYRNTMQPMREYILECSPFFSLKTILYEAGKEYYHQKELLRYIDEKMEGRLWSITFQSDSDHDVIIGSDEGMYAANMKRWEFFADFQDTAKTSEGQWFSALAAIGRQQGYRSMKVQLTIPEYSAKASLFSLRPADSGYSVKASLFSPIYAAEGQNIRYSLEAFVFSNGSSCYGFMIVLFLGWLYLIARLLFGKENTINTKSIIDVENTIGAEKINAEIAENGALQGSQKRLFSFERLPIELWFLLSIVSMFLACSFTEYLGGYRRFFISIIFMLLFDVTLAYALGYAMAAALIRLIRGGMLWKNSLVVWGWNWVQRSYQDFIQNVWLGLGYKRKTILLALSYTVGNLFCGIAGTLLLIECLRRHHYYHYYGEYWPCLLVGFFLLVFLLFLQMKAVSYVMKNEMGKDRIVKGIRKLLQGNLEFGINTEKLSGDYLEMAELLSKIQDSLNKAVQKSIRDERMKTELITNVSHDIKTPLTSIINYIDLLKRAKPQGEHVEHYLEVLTQKSERLRQLIEDLVEASKASSGALPLEKRELDLTELIQQAAGEFQEKLAQRKLQILVNFPQPPVTIFADGRRMFRILENLLQNVYKYALEGTRVYLDLAVDDRKKAVLTLRNISAVPLNITEEELTERFVRGEESRTTEGSGLGLSIAKDLARLQGGEFILKIDGDLFKVVLIFPIVENVENVEHREERENGYKK